jgi:Zn-finger nucleic acid-binding protein
MKCPNCVDTLLVMADKQGVEIDYCPNCRGVWLDRGELDKLLEKSKAFALDNRTGRSDAASAHRPHYPDGYDKDDARHMRYRKKSWLEELFD